MRSAYEVFARTAFCRSNLKILAAGSLRSGCILEYWFRVQDVVVSLTAVVAVVAAAEVLSALVVVVLFFFVVLLEEEDEVGFGVSIVSALILFFSRIMFVVP